MAPRRRFEFEGTQKEYLRYLENELLSWQSRARNAEQQLTALRSRHLQAIPPLPSGILDIVEVETPETFHYKIKTPIERPKWETATSDFLAQVPTTKAQWFERRMEVQLSTPEQIINAFHLLTFRRHDTHSSYPSAEMPASPLEAVGAYGNLSGFLQTTSECSKQLYNYSQLLFFGVCRVARENGLTVEKVDKIVKKQLPGRKASSEYMSRLRRAAKWTAQLIDKLEDTLGHLAPSLFLLCGPAIDTYREYTTWVETAEYLAGQIEKKTEPLQLKPPREARISFSPAFLIVYVGPWTLDQVNAALGTTLTQEEYDDRIRILQETEAFVRQSCVRSTAVSDDGASSPPATESASTRGGEETASCHSDSGRVRAAQEASSLHLLADVAGRAHAERRFAEPVPTLGPTEPISGSPHAFCHHRLSVTCWPAGGLEPSNSPRQATPPIPPALSLSWMDPVCR